jgi:hypothetical protein
MTTEDIRSVVKKIVEKLVLGRYEDIYQEDITKEMPVEVMKSLIDEYGEKLTMPPEYVFDKIEVYEISSDEVSIDCELWTNGERSDLTLICNLKNTENGIVYTVEDIHVL